ncbi:xylosyltransferase oxt isoform X1 [Parasteatoda tepidariorum]|uniref:xylosyltransferase oxt isoform X1 n=1 Tax=Parasteatoda tepidariorum TaxID=114398 RepID=UPI001C728677|nr:xylosyltransferase oxt [Parasteatoda tepidariorum]
MATYRVLSVLFCRTYRLYIVIFAAFLILQLILAISFYKDKDDNSELFFTSTFKKKVNNQALDKNSKQHKSYQIDPGIDDYIIDDEDRQGNMWEKLLKDSSSRNISPKDSDKPKYGHISVPEDDEVKKKLYIASVNGSRKLDKLDGALNLDELDFRPWCNITTKEAVTAIHRATTQACKHEIANITCLMQQGMLYPKRLPRFCPLKGDVPNKNLGCFKDNFKKRLLSNYSKKLNNNSPTHCIDLCLQSGYQYAGVQYAKECFCGKEKPLSEFKISEEFCKMECPQSPLEKCGGYFTMNVFHTGLPTMVKLDPKPAVKVIEGDPVRIVFLLTVNGRAVRQVYRLIKALFSHNHYFYIHVDSRQDYMYRKLKALEKHFSNIRLSEVRLSTIWGGASLLQMLLVCISELLLIKDWKWDYVINLSESDFPIKSLSSLEKFLIANNGKNFVKSHGQDTQRFIAKQGLDKTFYECDTHMWRLGDRTLPWGIRVDGGSDWIGLHRSFCSYVVQQNNSLLHGLMTVFRYTLLPAESFFHTVLQNSEFCETVIDNNLHVTNWKRKQGCKCQYKHIVDWCGCSPNVFKPEDWPRLQATEDRPYYFARKFEPIINQQIIEQVETWIHGARKGVINMDSYWQNDYHFLDKSPVSDDSRISIYESFSRIGLKQLQAIHQPCKVKFLSLKEATIYSVNDVFKGLLILYEASLAKEKKPVIIETQVRPIQHYVVYKSIGPTGRLKFLLVGTDYDLKEQVFRNFGRILGPFSEPGLIHKWGPGTSFSATFVWVDPTNSVAGSYEVKIESGNQILYHKPVFRTPLRPGAWTLKLLYEWELVAETRFLVTPLSVYNGQEVSSEQVKFLHNGPGQPYVDHDFSNVETLLGFTNKSTQLRQALANSRRFGRDLKEWTDMLVGNFWSTQDTCFIHQPQHPTGGAVCHDLDLDPCHLTSWSSLAEDPKSIILDLKSENNVT